MKTVLHAVLFACVISTAMAVDAPLAPAPAKPTLTLPPLAPGEPTYDLDSLFKCVRPLAAPLKGRFPIFVWCIPPFAYENDDMLKKQVDEMGRRGLATWPNIRFAHSEQWPNLVKLARFTQDAGQPVHLLMPDAQLPGGSEKLWPQPDMWIEPRNDGSYGGKTKWPILPRVDTSYAAAQVAAALAPFKAAGIEVAGLWSDDEGQPNPWNGIHPSQKLPIARKQYPDPTVLDSSDSFKLYVLNLRGKVLHDVFVAPLRQLWPQAVYGNYAEVVSWGPHPFIVPNNVVFPDGVETAALAGGIMQPVCYAHPGTLAKNIPDDLVPDQKFADGLYFHLMLRTASTGLANERPELKTVLWVSSNMTHLTAFPERTRDTFLTPAFFREFLRHTMLRGADGFAVYNTGFYTGGYSTTPRQSFAQVDDVVAVYNELLPRREIRDFLEKGSPMTFDVPIMLSQGAVWSGMAYRNRCLLRVAGLGTADVTVTIPTFPGESVTINAPATGAYYLLVKGQRPQQLSLEQEVKP